MKEALRFDPVPSLLSTGNEAISFFVRRDLLGETGLDAQNMWELPFALKIIRKQGPDGSWKYPGRPLDLSQNYDLLETFRNLGFLVEKFEFTREHPAVQKAAGFLFSCQSGEGDFRGIYANQYSPTYSPAIMEILIKAGYSSDPHIEKGFDWLLNMRQDDGGWAVPQRTKGVRWRDACIQREPILPDRSKPFSHLVTGMVLRAFAAHPEYRSSPEAIHAGNLLASRFFLPDKYIDRQEPVYWEKVSFPFWFTDIVSALDSLSFMGFTRDNTAVCNALAWLCSRQEPDGLFALQFLRTGGDRQVKPWVSLAVCRLFKRYC